MASKRKYYNNGEVNLMINIGDPIPEGFVPGMVPRTKEKNDEITKKRHQTNLERYGVEAPLQSAEIREKTKRTNLQRYGVENPLQTEEARELLIQGSLEKYGTMYPSQSEEIKEQIRQTNLERYGVDNPSKSDEIKEKIKQVNLERYGVEFPIQLDEFKDKVRQTNKEKFGVEIPLRSAEAREKAKQTNFERYGVPWTCMRPEARIGSNNSEPNRRFTKLLENYNVSYERESHIGVYSYDFKVGNIFVEINPSWTHNTLWSPFGDHSPRVDKDYHKKKSLLAEGEGFHCIHIFDWDDEDKIIRLLLSRERVYARKCELHEVSEIECNRFLIESHLQGTCKGQSVRLGLYYEGELISLMTFGKPRYNKNYEYELLRYSASKLVVGGSERLFRYFIQEYHPLSIISYCDRSKFKGEVYSRLGFILKAQGAPSKHWYSPKDMKHFTDNLVRQRGVDQLLGTSYGKGTSNEELLIEHGFVPIFDCGQDTYVYTKKDSV